MKTISAYELVSMLGEEEKRDFFMSGKDLNELHRVLLTKNIRSDFSRTAFEELGLSYPHNIEVKSQQIIITVEHAEVTTCIFKSRNKDEVLSKIVIEEWKTIKEF